MAKEIYESLSDISEKFDAFLFDLWGTIWNGTEFYNGALDLMTGLRRRGKIVYILSNYSQVEWISMQDYGNLGMYQNTHYDEFVTSGQVAHDILKGKKIGGKQINLGLNGTKFYNLGRPNKDLFAFTSYQQVTNPKNANFFYIGYLALSQTEFSELSADQKQFVHAQPYGKSFYILKDLGPFMPKLNALLDLKLPLFSANPDMTFCVNQQGKSIEAIAQGMASKKYKEMGGTVIEIGKPYSIIYDYVLDRMQAKGRRPYKRRIAMVGDTVRTDVAGAKNAGLASILVIGDGVTAKELANGATLSDIFKREKAKPDYIIRHVR